MIMSKDNIILYDNALLRKERGIKIANVVVALLFLLCVGPFLFLLYLENLREILQDPHLISKILAIIIFFLLIEHINYLHLKHIASIKLYRSGKIPLEFRAEEDMSTVAS